MKRESDSIWKKSDQTKPKRSTLNPFPSDSMEYENDLTEKRHLNENKK